MEPHLVSDFPFKSYNRLLPLKLPLLEVPKCEMEGSMLQNKHIQDEMKLFASLVITVPSRGRDFCFLPDQSFQVPPLPQGRP